MESLKGLPWGRGAVVGILSLLIPYVTIMVGSLVLLQRQAAATGTNIFFTVAGFGPGWQVRNLFVSGSSISDLDNVRPGDYPDVETELERVLDMLGSSTFGPVGDPTATPEALFLGLYVLFPLILYLGGRYVARNHAADGDLFEHAAAPLTFVAGTIPVVVLLVTAFPVVQPGGRIALAAFVLPLVFGFAGAMTVYAFRDVSWFTSKAYGWAAGVVGLFATVLLYPVPSSDVVSVGIVEQFVFGVHGFVSTVSFGTGLAVPESALGSSQDLPAQAGFGFGADPLGLLIVFLVFTLVVVAGFVRVYRSSNTPPSGLAAARLGGSVVLGYLAMVALFGILLPLLVIIAAPSLLETVLVRTVPDVAAYTALLLVGGTIVPLALGGLGGTIAYQVGAGQPGPQGSPGRPSPGAPGPQGAPGAQGGQPPRQPPQGGGQRPSTDASGQPPAESEEPPSDPPGRPPARPPEGTSGRSPAEEASESSEGPGAGQTGDTPAGTDPEDR